MRTHLEETILTALRANVEGCMSEGFRQVYLPNARPANVSGAQFAAILSNLEQKHLYRATGDKAFGEVRIGD